MYFIPVLNVSYRKYHVRTKIIVLVYALCSYDILLIYKTMLTLGFYYLGDHPLVLIQQIQILC